MSIPPPTIRRDARVFISGVLVVGLLALGLSSYVGWRQRVERRVQERERRAQEQERAKQEPARIANEAERKEAQTIKQIQQEFAERFLRQLVANKQTTAEDARQRALKELPALVKLPLAEIESLIDRKIAPRVGEASLSALERARTALAQGNYDAVFAAADVQAQQGRELAMLDGTAALARFRQSPKPECNERALAAFQRAMALADPNSATEWQAWTDAAVSAGSVLRDIARYAEAEPLLRECLRLREANSGAKSAGVAVVLNNLAMLLQATNRLAEAEPLYRRALAIDERSYGPDHPDVARDLNNLAQLLQATNRLTEAEPLYCRALAIDERSYGPDHPEVVIDLNILATLLQATNRLAEAEPLYRRALAIDERSYGADHPSVARDLSNLAQLLQATNRLAEAEPLTRRALAIDERSYGPDHPSVARHLDSLATMLQTTNRLAEAEPLYRRTLAIDERSYGPDHTDVARDLNKLAMLLQATNRLAEAEPLMARVVRVYSQFTRASGHKHSQLPVATNNYRLLLTLIKLGDPEIDVRLKAARNATDKLSPIVPEVERVLGPAKPVADVLALLDRQYKEQGKPAIFSLRPEEPITPHLTELLQPNAELLNAQGVAAFRQQAYANAVVLYDMALEHMPDQPAMVPAKLRTRMNRAAALRELGLVPEARDELVKLVPELDQNPATDATTKGRAHYHLALCLWRLREWPAAERQAEESVVAYEGATDANPVDPALREQSLALFVNLSKHMIAPPLAAIDAAAALESARAGYRAREALANPAPGQNAAPLLDQLLGPARPTQDVFAALDREYREQGKPPVWFLPLDEPIAPHLDELLGKPAK